MDAQAGRQEAMYLRQVTAASIVADHKISLPNKALKHRGHREHGELR